MDNYHFRRAKHSEIDIIWKILQDAIQRRKEDGSTQWQDGYPNPTVVQNDIANNQGYVLTDGEKIVAYAAILINDEPEYEKIVGKWLTNEDFVVYHRVAVSSDYIGKGMAIRLMEAIENFATEHKIYSLKADTNFDNPAMIRSFEKLGYTYCGEVYFRGSARKAYEKVLKDK